MAEHSPRAEVSHLSATSSKRPFDALGLDSNNTDISRAGGSRPPTGQSDQLVDEGSGRSKRARSSSTSPPADVAHFAGSSRAVGQRPSNAGDGEDDDPFQLDSASDISRLLPGMEQTDLVSADSFTDNVHSGPLSDLMDVDADGSSVPQPHHSIAVQVSSLSPQLRAEFARTATISNDVSAMRGTRVTSPQLPSYWHSSEGSSRLNPPLRTATTLLGSTMEDDIEDDWSPLLAETRRSVFSGSQTSTLPQPEDFPRSATAPTNPAPSRPTYTDVYTRATPAEEPPFPFADRVATSMRDAANGRGPRSARPPSLFQTFSDDLSSSHASRRLSDRTVFFESVPLAERAARPAEANDPDPWFRFHSSIRDRPSARPTLDTSGNISNSRGVPVVESSRRYSHLGIPGRSAESLRHASGAVPTPEERGVDNVPFRRSPMEPPTTRADSYVRDITSRHDVEATRLPMREPPASSLFSGYGFRRDNIEIPHTSTTLPPVSRSALRVDLDSLLGGLSDDSDLDEIEALRARVYSREVAAGTGPPSERRTYLRVLRNRLNQPSSNSSESARSLPRSPSRSSPNEPHSASSLEFSEGVSQTSSPRLRPRTDFASGFYSTRPTPSNSLMSEGTAERRMQMIREQITTSRSTRSYDRRDATIESHRSELNSTHRERDIAPWLAPTEDIVRRVSLPGRDEEGVFPPRSTVPAGSDRSGRHSYNDDEALGSILGWSPEPPAFPDDPWQIETQLSYPTDIEAADSEMPSALPDEMVHPPSPPHFRHRPLTYTPDFAFPHASLPQLPTSGSSGTRLSEDSYAEASSSSRGRAENRRSLGSNLFRRRQTAASPVEQSTPLRVSSAMSTLDDMLASTATDSDLEANNRVRRSRMAALRERMSGLVSRRTSMTESSRPATDTNDSANGAGWAPGRDIDHADDYRQHRHSELTSSNTRPFLTMMNNDAPRSRTPDVLNAPSTATRVHATDEHRAASSSGRERERGRVFSLDDFRDGLFRDTLARSSQLLRRRTSTTQTQNIGTPNEMLARRNRSPDVTLPERVYGRPPIPTPHEAMPSGFLPLRFPGAEARARRDAATDVQNHASHDSSDPDEATRRSDSRYNWMMSLLDQESYSSMRDAPVGYARRSAWQTVPDRPQTEDRLGEGRTLYRPYSLGRSSERSPTDQQAIDRLDIEWPFGRSVAASGEDSADLRASSRRVRQQLQRPQAAELQLPRRHEYTDNQPQVIVTNRRRRAGSPPPEMFNGPFPEFRRSLNRSADSTVRRRSVVVQPEVTGRFPPPTRVGRSPSRSPARADEEARQSRERGPDERRAAMARARMHAARRRQIDTPHELDWRSDTTWASRLRFIRRSLGDYMRDEDLDTSYEGLLHLASVMGDALPRGTPEDIIARLPTALYRDWASQSSDERCPICLDDYEQTDPVLKVSDCSHWFHKLCLEKWLKTARTCPVCRGRVTGRVPHQHCTEATEAGPSTAEDSGTQTMPSSMPGDDEETPDDWNEDDCPTPRIRSTPPWRS